MSIAWQLAYSRAGTQESMEKIKGLSAPPKGHADSFTNPDSVGVSHARAVKLPRGKNYQDCLEAAAQQPMQDTVFGKRAIWTQLKNKQQQTHDTKSETSSHLQKYQH